MKKDKFLKYFKKSLWFILYAIAVYIEINLLIISFDMLFYEFTNQFVFLDYSFVSTFSLPCSYTWVGIFTYYLWKIFSELSLYIFSYHIYCGSANRYKFFKEKEKIHKKEDSEEFKLLVKQEKEKRINKKAVFCYSKRVDY